MKFALTNLGCKVNRVEADSIGAALIDAGWEHVASQADVAIVNTCTVTAEADRKTRKEVNRAVSHNPKAMVVVTGCAAEINPDVYTALSNRVQVVSKAQVVDVCLAHAGLSRPATPALLRTGSGYPTRVGIKIQDGCDNACTFCIVHVARGKATSVPWESVVEEVQAYEQVGVREVVLTGIDLGAYTDKGVSLAQLLVRLREYAPHTRLRISSIEPVTIDKDLISLLASQDGMVCRHLHIPLQSGSSKVLHEMARRYTADEYVQIISNLRNAVPGISLSTDIIVGFPGETDDEFNQTLEVARTCGFSRIHIFRYSKRVGTPAANRDDQIPPEIKAARFKELEACATQLRQHDAQSRIGNKERVLVESSGQGMTESYYPVKMPSDAQVGTLVEGTLQSIDKDGRFTL